MLLVIQRKYNRKFSLKSHKWKKKKNHQTNVENNEIIQEMRKLIMKVINDIQICNTKIFYHKKNTRLFFQMYNQ